jgi:hypothetical protein
MANKRIRPSRSRSKEDLLSGLDSPAPKQRQRLAKQSEDMTREIHRLECLIAAAPHLQKKRQLERINLLPPPEEFASRDRRVRAAQRRPLPMNARKIQQKQRTLQIVQLAILLTTIAALAGWMRQWFGF